MTTEHPQMIDDRPPPPPSTPPPPRRLYRSVNDRKVAGVCGGIGQYFGVDPTLIRLATLILLFTGVGVIAYLGAWILVPEGEQTSGPAPRRPGEPLDRNVAIAIGLFAIALLIGAAEGLFFGDGIVVSLALIGGGVYLLSQRPLASEPPPAVPPDQVRDATVDPPAGWAPPAPGSSDTPAEPTTTPMAAWGPPPVAAPPVAVEREPAIVTRLTLSAVALVVAGAIAARAAGWFDPSVPGVIGLIVAVLGAGIAVGAFRGGSRGLIPLGLLSLLVLAPALAIGPTVDRGVGERSYRPIELSELRDRYDHGIGELVVDLRDLELAGETRTVEVDLGIGNAEVLVPAGAEVIATGDIDMGDLRVLDRRQDGIDNELDEVRRPGDPEVGTLIIELHVGMGRGEVR